jgi:hypothetical protein
MPSVERYLRHLERFGPECLLQTAAGDDDLARKDLIQLKAVVESRERVDVFKRGSWQPRKERAPRLCDHCGLELPPGSIRSRRFHEHCRSARYKRAARARSRAKSTEKARP